MNGMIRVGSVCMFSGEPVLVTEPYGLNLGDRSCGYTVTTRNGDALICRDSELEVMHTPEQVLALIGQVAA